MGDFYTTYGFLITSMVLAAAMALSLYLPLMAGQLSLASPGFYAIGGYIAAVLSTQVFHPEGPYPLYLVGVEVIVAAVVSAVLAIAVGVPALRLRGIYLALATIAFVEIVRILSLNLPILGGAIGIFGIPQPFTTQGEYLWLGLPLLIFAIVFIYRLERTRMGRAFSAIREDEVAADAMGINTTFAKVVAFTMGAVLAGMVGVVAAHFLNTWNSRQGTFESSVNYLAYVLIGGSWTVFGPVVGGLLLTALPEALRGLASFRFILYGILIAVGAVFFPQGIITPELLKRLRGGKGPSQPAAGGAQASRTHGSAQ
ncbi:MAG: branched-chain amino acid ABC transporter permease [Anaerolineae bacterium]